MVPDGITIDKPSFTAPPPVSQEISKIDRKPPEKVEEIKPVEKKNGPARLSSEMLEKLSEDLNDDIKVFNTAVSFSVDNDSQKTVIKIMNRDTNEVIREIPPEELLDIASKLTEVIGHLVDKTV